MKGWMMKASIVYGTKDHFKLIVLVGVSWVQVSLFLFVFFNKAKSAKWSRSSDNSRACDKKNTSGSLEAVAAESDALIIILIRTDHGTIDE